jgi:chemotaxis signal transduction protein
MCNILSYINDLYTVYTNLFIYDKNGVIVAVSKKSEEHLIGRKLTEEWVSKTLGITDSSKYYVSDFEQSNLYDSKHTYIYNASIRSLVDEEKVLGGIGIVFDAESQFEAMINESLPKQNDGKIKDGLHSVLTTENQIIISSNNNEYNSGDFFNIDKKFFDLKTGDSLSEIVEYKGKYYALGVKCSKGYREYKSQDDDYVNNVYNFVFSYISDVAETIVDVNDEFALEKDIPVENDKNSIDVASFIIGSEWLGVNATDVIEAVSINELKSTIKMDADHHFKGTIIYKDTMVSVIDIQNFLQVDMDKEYEEIVILKFGSKDNYIGILVNSLSDIPEVHTDNIRPLQEYIIGNGTLIKSMVFPSKQTSNEQVLSILSIDKINENLVSPNETYMIPHTLSA